MKRARSYRWALLLAALFCFVYAAFVDHSPLWAAGFLTFGGLWHWLERRKMRELDAPRPK